MKALILIAAALVGMTANAEVAGPAWACKVNGVISGESAGFFLSITNIEGKGQISCESVNGVKRDVDVNIKVVGVGAGFGYSKYESIEVASATIGLADGPEALIGSYSVGPTAGVTLIEAGIDVGAAVKVSKEGGLGFELGFVGKKATGLEVKLQLQSVEITAAE